MRHLDAKAVAELDRGDEGVRAYFAEHLGAACEECETFLAGSEVLDGAADVALIGGEARDARLDELGWRRMQSALAPQASPLRGSAQEGALTLPLSRREMESRRNRIIVLTGSIAACLLAVVGVWRVTSLSSQRSDEGIKSIGPALTLELQAARRDERGTVTRVDMNASVPASGELVLRYYATERGGAVLLRRTRDGGLEALGAFALDPGAHPLTLDSGDVAALPLDGEAGTLTLYLVGAPGRAPSLDQAKAAVNDRNAPAGLSLTHLSLTVVSNR